MSLSDAIAARYQEAEQAIREERPQDALPILEDLIQQQPDEALFWWQSGYVLKDLQRWPEAIRRFKRALELDPDNWPALGGLGHVYRDMALHFLKKSERAFRQRLTLKRSPAQHLFLADVLRRQGEHERSAFHCRRAIELDPTFGEAYYNLFLALRGLGRTKDANQALEQSAALDATYKPLLRPKSSQGSKET